MGALRGRYPPPRPPWLDEILDLEAALNRPMTPEPSDHYMSLISPVEHAAREGNLPALKERLETLHYAKGQHETRTGCSLLLAVRHQHR